MKNIKLSVLASLAVAVLAVPAHAQFKNAEDAVKYRQGAFKVMGVHMGSLGAMAQGKAPFNAAVAAKDAAVIDELASLPWKAFGADTQKDPGSNAKAKVWSDKAGFDKLAADLEKATAALNKAAATGDKAAIGVAAGAVGKVCKACHDDYRE